MSTVLIVLLLVVSLPFPGMVMYTLDKARYNTIIIRLSAAAAFAVALSIQVCIIEHTRSAIALLATGITLAFNLIVFQGMGEEENE